MRRPLLRPSPSCSSAARRSTGRPSSRAPGACACRLPTYAFQRQPLLAATPPARAVRRRVASAWRPPVTRCSAPPCPSPDRTPSCSPHGCPPPTSPGSRTTLVAGSVIVPGTALVELALAGSRPRRLRPHRRTHPPGPAGAPRAGRGPAPDRVDAPDDTGGRRAVVCTPARRTPTTTSLDPARRRHAQRRHEPARCSDLRAWPPHGRRTGRHWPACTSGSPSGGLRVWPAFRGLRQVWRPRRRLVRPGRTARRRGRRGRPPSDCTRHCSTPCCTHWPWGADERARRPAAVPVDRCDAATPSAPPRPRPDRRAAATGTVTPSSSPTPTGAPVATVDVAVTAPGVARPSPQATPRRATSLFRVDWIPAARHSTARPGPGPCPATPPRLPDAPAGAYADLDALGAASTPRAERPATYPHRRCYRPPCAGMAAVTDVLAAVREWLAERAFRRPHAWWS